MLEREFEVERYSTWRFCREHTGRMLGRQVHQGIVLVSADSSAFDEVPDERT